MMDWRNELGSILAGKARGTRAEQENAIFEAFLDTVAIPALQDVAEELGARHGRDAKIRRAPASATLSVRYNDIEEITFHVMKQFVQSGILPRAEVWLNRGQKRMKKEDMFRTEKMYPISAVTKDDIILCFLKYYRLGMDGGE